MNINIEYEEIDDFIFAYNEVGSNEQHIVNFSMLKKDNFNDYTLEEKIILKYNFPEVYRLINV